MLDDGTSGAKTRSLAFEQIQMTGDFSFKIFYEIERPWGPHTIDRFANFRNTKLSRFNSLSWNPGTEDVDAFAMDWHGKNNHICSPVFLIPRVLRHMMNC